MAQKASLSTKQFPAKTSSLKGAVIPLHQKILPRHRMLLLRWLEAGEKMGLLDAHITQTHTNTDEQIVIWVRENSNPAYIIRPKGHSWSIIDALQEKEIGNYRCFTTTLNHIRPVLHISQTLPH